MEQEKEQEKSKVQEENVKVEEVKVQAPAPVKKPDAVKPLPEPIKNISPPQSLS